MDLLTIFALGVSAIGALILRFVATEIQDWMPAIARKIVENAVARLPQEDQKRYGEEWLAHLDEYPGKLAKLVQALGCIRGAEALAVSLRQSAKRSDAQLATEIEPAATVGSTVTSPSADHTEHIVKLALALFEKELSEIRGRPMMILESSSDQVKKCDFVFSDGKGHKHLIDVKMFMDDCGVDHSTPGCRRVVSALLHAFFRKQNRSGDA